MLSAKRKSDGKVVLAYFEKRSNGSFLCLDCNEEVVLRSGRRKVDHFAHVDPRRCERNKSESDLHRRCKMEIYEGLRKAPNVRDVALERAMGPVRPDVFAYVDGVPVAIEVQISSLSLESILDRTIWYHRKGIYVLWLLPWTPKLDGPRYSPKLWEKWVHTCYFGRAYYWLDGLNVASYALEPSLKTVPRTTWLDKGGKRMTAGGYAKRSVRYRVPVRGQVFNIAKDFGPKERLWWASGQITLPDAKLYCDSSQNLCEYRL